jgi:biotin-dependent carboxylase-like uncharacterized protein
VSLRILAAGPLSTIQDAGRRGYQRYGVSVAGAFDPLYLAAANALVGNDAMEGAIELTMIGDTYEVATDSVRVALAGDFPATIDGEAAAAWRSHTLTRGQVLKIGAARAGLRGYLAVAGGFDLVPQLGSVATHLRNRLGGLDGGRLKAGDVLPLRLNAAPAAGDRALDPALLPRRGLTLRVVPGPQDGHFSAEHIATFLGGAWTIGRESDRMGCRLEGPVIGHAKGFNIISDGIPLGAVQVPGSGQPIILLPDRQTAGGYPKIACVIAPDIAALAQARPGDVLRFEAVMPTAALAAHRAWRDLIAGLPALTRPAGSGGFDSERLLSLNLVGGMVDAINPLEDA